MPAPKPTLSNPVRSLRAIIDRYDAVICDLWGVIHGGSKIYPAAYDCLLNLHQIGLPVILLSNSPRPVSMVRMQLEQKGLEPEMFGDIISSGELTRLSLANKEHEGLMYHMGLEADRALFEGLSLSETNEASKADFAICSGFMAGKTPDIASHQPVLEQLSTSGAHMLCANPDKFVEIRGKKFLCAGTLAEHYEHMGGVVTRYGKPEKTAYDYCFARLAEILDADINRERVLCIGDNMETDVLGAKNAGCGALLITSGVHKGHFEKEQGKIFYQRDQSGVENFYSKFGVNPDWVMKKLRWNN